MRAYLSFLLVLLSLLLVFSLLELNIRSSNFKVLVIERSYSLSMNVKENIIESLRQGAWKGFDEYDQSHDIKLCRHCAPCLPSDCNPSLCGQCFREQEARGQAEASAISAFMQLVQHQFDPDFQILISDPGMEIITESDPLSKNGYALNSVRLNRDIDITTDSKFGTKGTAKVPEGMMIYESAGDS